jgi:hypothetical protein
MATLLQRDQIKPLGVQGFPSGSSLTFHMLRKSLRMLQNLPNGPQIEPPRFYMYQTID